MKIKQLFLLVFFIPVFCTAQTYNIKIAAIDIEKQIAVPDAAVQLSDLHFSITDNKGEATLSNIIGGIYTLKISHIGYKTYESEIKIVADTTLTIKLYSKNIKLNEVIVTSSKYEQDINMLPYSVSSISMDEVQVNPSFTVPDLLKTEPGISLMRDGIWGTEVSIRGMSRANVVTLVDGFRMETSTDIAARLSMIDLNDVERIEVVKGASSVLYGSGATGGTINIISKTGSYHNKFTLNGSYYGGFNSVNNFYSNAINIYASGVNWIAKLSGSYRKAQNTQTPSGELLNSQFEDNSIGAMFQIKPFDNHEIKLNYQLFNAKDVGIPGAAPLFPNTATVTYPAEKRNLYSIEYKVNNLSESFVKLSAKYFHQFISRDVENIPNSKPVISQAPFRRVSVLKISPGADHNVDGFQTQVDFSFANNYFIAGFDFWKRNYDGLRTREQKIEVLNPADTSVVSTLYKTIYEKPLPNADYSSAGIYLQDELKLFEGLNLTFGGRYDFIWLENEETKNPLYETNNGVVNNNPAGQKIIWQAESANNKSYVFSTGAVYLLNDAAVVSFNAARSFRSPSLEERYQFIDQGSVVRIGDPELKPEHGYFFDLGFRYFPEDLKFTTSIFANPLSDLVTETKIYDGATIDTLKKVNIGEALLYGFEYSIDFKVFERWNLYNTLSYVRGLNQLDDTNLPQMPPLNTMIGIKYLISDWFTADLSAIIFDDQSKIATGEIATPGYVLFSLALNYSQIKFAGLILGLSAGVENILDKGYRNHLSTNRGSIVSEPGRNFYMRLNVAF